MQLVLSNRYIVREHAHRRVQETGYSTTNVLPTYTLHARSAKGLKCTLRTTFAVWALSLQDAWEHFVFQTTVFFVLFFQPILTFLWSIAEPTRIFKLSPDEGWGSLENGWVTSNEYILSYGLLFILETDVKSFPAMYKGKISWQFENLKIYKNLYGKHGETVSGWKDLFFP